MRSIELQRKYVQTLQQRRREAIRVYGIGSKPHLEMQDCYWRQLQKLRKMEDENGKR